MTNKRNVAYENLLISNQDFLDEINEAIINVSNSGYYILGPENKSFEEEFARYIGADHCISVANGLDALTLSLIALDLPSNSEILVASNTYIATILSIISSGHRPVLIEPDIHTYNIDPKLIEEKISSKTSAICVTHLYGKSCRMEDICDIAEKFSLKIVEDCAQSHGASLNGKMTGTFGDAGCFSFYPTKNLGAFGDAGAILTNNSEFADKLRHLRNYGSSVKYHNKYVGVNSRMDELQAAVLRVKLKYLDKITQKKQKLANYYFNNIHSDILVPSLSNDEIDVFHIFNIRLENRDKIKSLLEAEGVKTDIHYPIPPHKQEAMQGYISGSYPISEMLSETQLSLPISYGTSIEDVEYVCSKLNKFL